MPTIPNIDEDMEAPAEAAGVPLGSGQPEMPEHSEREGCEGGSEDEGDIHCDPGCCPSCEQKFGEPDKDALPGHTMMVSTAKQDISMSALVLCLKCTYVKRGSFKSMTAAEFIKLKRKCRPLSDKIAALRRKLVVALCRNPRSKPRHEIVDHKLYTTRKSSDYVDFRQEGSWYELKEYFKKVADDESKKKLKSHAQQKGYLQKLGLLIQPDERGVEGVVVLDGPKKVLLGHRLSASKTTQSGHADRASMDAVQQEDAEKLKIQAQTKDEEAAALADREEEEEAEPVVDDDEDEKGSSDEDNWGVPKVQEKPKPKPGRTGGAQKRQREKQEEEASKTVPKQQAVESMPPPKNPARVPTTVPKTLDKLISQSNAMLQTLKQVNPLLVWQSQSKLKDCDVKLNKAVLFIEGLKAAEQTDACQSVLKELCKCTKDLDNWTNLINNLKPSSLDEVSDVLDFMNYIAENEGKIAKLLGKYPPECVKLAICELGRLYAEASVIAAPMTDGYRSALYQFISMVELQQFKSFSILSFGKICAAAKTFDNKALDESFFLELQLSIFNSWLDRLRTMPEEASQPLLSHIPDEFKQPHLLRIQVAEDKYRTNSLQCEDAEGVEFQNASGLGLRVLMDFQKLAVCSTMLATSDSTSAEHLRPEEKGDIKMAISQPGQFSAKMNLTFRSNALLRKLWESATTVSKNVLSEKKAAEISSSVLDNARKLNAFLGSSECTPSDEFLAMVDGCKDLLDITATLASKEGGVPELGQALNDLKETMKQFGVDSMTKLGDWFAKQWLLVPETTGFDAVEKDNFRALTSSLKIRGRVCTSVLKEEPETNLRMLWTIEKVEAFLNNDDESEPSLRAAWILGKGIHDDLRVAKMSVFQNGQWASPCVRASQRLQQLVTQKGPGIVTKILQEQTEESVKTAQCLLAGLEGLSGRLPHIKSILEDLGNLDAYASMEAPKDLVQVCKDVSAIVKAVGYDMEILEALKPDAKSKIVLYLDQVKKALDTIIGDIEKDAATWEKLVLRYKPVLSAAEMWQPEKIAELSWMFAGDAAVDKETKVIVSLRDQLPQHLGAMKGITSCKSSFRNDAKLLELVEQVLALQEKIEELNVVSAQVVSTMMAMEVVINPDKYPDKLASSRQVCSFISRKLGLSKHDLTPLLMAKFDDLVAAAPSEVPQNADSAKQKRRRQSEAPDPKVSEGPQKRAPSAKSDPSSNGKASAKSGAKKQKK